MRNVRVKIFAFALLCALALIAIAIISFTANPKQKIVREAYIYGYPLVTMDMTRRQETNVRVPDDAHAPMGQLIKLRTYPAVDNHTAAAPNADTLYTMVWLDVSTEPWVFSIPDMGDRYLHHADVERLQRGVLCRRPARHGRQAPRNTPSPGPVGRARCPRA